MFGVEPLKYQIEAYLKKYREIGVIIDQNKAIPNELVKKTSEPLLPQRAFETLVNNFWTSYNK